MIDQKLLSNLCCPQTKQRLKLADDSLTNTLNERIAQGTLKNQAGQVVKVKLDSGLVREDGKLLYPIQNALPILLTDEAIPVS